MVAHLFDCKWVVFLVEPLLFVGVSLAEKLMLAGTWHPFCLEIRGSNAHFFVIVRAYQTSSQREAADTRSPSGEDALEALTESTPPVHPEVCSGCNQTIKTHVTCVGPAVATSDWECRSRSACCPYRDGLCFWRHQDLKRLGNMGGERGAMWLMNARDEDVCCFDCGRIAHSTSMLQATWREQAHRARRTSRSATCAGHCQWHWKRSAFWNCF